MSTAVSNNTTKCCAKQNATQPSLWEETDPSQKTYELSFGWADGDRSPEWTQRMLAIVTGNTHYLYSYEVINGRLVFWYANVLQTWIADGMVWGRCEMTPEGSYVREMQSGVVSEESEGEDE